MIYSVSGSHNPTLREYSLLLMIVDTALNSLLLCRSAVCKMLTSLGAEM